MMNYLIHRMAEWKKGILVVLVALCALKAAAALIAMTMVIGHRTIAVTSSFTFPGVHGDKWIIPFVGVFALNALFLIISFEIFKTKQWMDWLLCRLSEPSEKDTSLTSDEIRLFCERNNMINDFMELSRLERLLHHLAQRGYLEQTDKSLRARYKITPRGVHRAGRRLA